MMSESAEGLRPGGFIEKRLHPISENLYLYRDTCNVYVLVCGSEAVLVDFGSGDVLDHLGEVGAERVSHILMTHHHRDQGQGLARGVEAGAQIWAPHTEQDLFQSVDVLWQAREVYNNYNVRQDRFSLLEPVPLAGTLQDYDTWKGSGLEITIVPTPGHTTGSISMLVEIAGMLAAFTGDLIAAPGKVWSMAATQWTYNGAEGAAASIASLLDLKERSPNLLLPSHGDPISEPGPAIDLLVGRLWELLQNRRENLRLFQLREKPYEAITPHLLKHRASMANTYVLLSESGKALFIDFGYDFITGIPAGSDRASRRPWLYTLPALKEQFDVRQVDAVILTHYHDDHVAGCNLLRRVTGAQVWAAENFAGILENPSAYDLPCLWYDPIPVDRRLPLEQSIRWEEYDLRLHALPGHTLYAVAVQFSVDGLRVLATGDQYQDDSGLVWNYVYQNGYRVGDYAASAALYRDAKPDLILPGHWQPLWVTPEFLSQLEERAACLESLHQDLMIENPNLGDGEFLASIRPYTLSATAGESMIFEVEVRNPFSESKELIIQAVAPPGWQARFVDSPAEITLESRETVTICLHVTTPPGVAVRRARLAVDVTLGGRRFGQQAEALLTVELPRGSEEPQDDYTFRP